MKETLIALIGLVVGTALTLLVVSGYVAGQDDTLDSYKRNINELVVENRELLERNHELMEANECLIEYSNRDRCITAIKKSPLPKLVEETK